MGTRMNDDQGRLVWEGKALGVIGGSGMLHPGDPNCPVVGRLMANAGFFRAFFAYAPFEQLRIYVGERSEIEPTRRQILSLCPEAGDATDRLYVGLRWDLPRDMASGGVGVVHGLSGIEDLPELWALRDMYAKAPLPVTGQIHSLSYPRAMLHYLWGTIQPAGCQDALFCSSRAGQQAVAKCFAHVERALAGAFDGEGAPRNEPALRPKLPVVPLAIETLSFRGEMAGRSVVRKVSLPRRLSLRVLAVFPNTTKWICCRCCRSLPGLEKRFRPNAPHTQGGSF